MKIKHSVFLRILIGASLLCTGLFSLSGCNEVFESVTRSCAYSEFILPAGEDMVNAEFTVEKPAFQGVGQDKNYACLAYLGKFGHSIINGVELSSTEVTWYADQGVQFQPLKVGTTFKMVGFVAVVKHGLGTIDSGKGPTYFMVVKDVQGTLYYVHVPALGINLDDRFMAMRRPGAASALISYEDFTMASDAEHPQIALGKNSSR